MLSAHLICFVFVSCAREPYTRTQTVPSVRSQPAEEELEAIPEPVAGAQKSTSQGSVTSDSYVEEAEPPAVQEEDVRLGYRVQIFASSSLEKAEDIARQARAVFTEQVYVEYSAPLYRVRVGDFLSKEEAMLLRDRAVESGYEGAWVAEAEVAR